MHLHPKRILPPHPLITIDPSHQVWCERERMNVESIISYDTLFKSTGMGAIIPDGLPHSLSAEARNFSDGHFASRDLAGPCVP